MASIAGYVLLEVIASGYSIQRLPSPRSPFHDSGGVGLFALIEVATLYMSHVLRSIHATLDA